MAWDREKERKAAKTYHIGVMVFALIFVAIWCVAAVAMGAWFMVLFALPMVGILVFRMGMALKQDQKTKSSEPWEQPDRQPTWEQPRQREDSKFCPYCGAPRQEDFEFCPKCGRRL